MKMLVMLATNRNRYWSEN